MSADRQFLREFLLIALASWLAILAVVLAIHPPRRCVPGVSAACAVQAQAARCPGAGSPAAPSRPRSGE